MYKEITKFILFYVVLFAVMAGVYSIVTPNQEISFYVSLSAISILFSAMPYIKFYAANGSKAKKELFKFMMLLLITYAFLAFLYKLLDPEPSSVFYIVLSLISGMANATPYIRFFVRNNENCSL